MPRYVAKGTEVEAVRVSSTTRFAASDWDSLPPWLEAAYDAGRAVFENNAVWLARKEGMVKATLDDWIVCAPDGTLYPFSDSLFTEMFKPVQET